MTVSGCTAISPVLKWLLPVQTAAAAVGLYSAFHIYGASSTPFVLALIAALLHFLVGFYCCFTQSKKPQLHAYIAPAWLVVAAGLWCSVLAYLGTTLNELSGPEGSLTWSEVGCGVCCVNLVVCLAQLVLVLLPACCQPRPSPPPKMIISGPMYSVLPIAAQFQNHYPAPVPPEMMGIHRPNDRKDSKPEPRSCTGLVSHTKTSTGSAPPPNVSPPNPVHQTPWYPYNQRNRIDVIRRLASLQHPDGYWVLSQELAELVKLWGASDLTGLTTPDDQATRKVTELTHACLTELCETLWAAQREGREHELLSATEMLSLRAPGGDLSWAKGTLYRASNWMIGSE